MSHIDVIQCPEYAKTPDDLISILYYMADDIVCDGVNYVDESIISGHKRSYMIEECIKDSLENDGFEVVYQPIYSVKDKAFISGEALVRMPNTGELGFVSPDEFILIAEKRGLIRALGEVVFKKVCQFIEQENLARLGMEYIEVNLSRVQCMDSELPVQLEEIMRLHGVSARQINLEITETAAVESDGMLRSNMFRLRSMGCSFSMDDFGTGYSNLAQMSEVNYDLIKIDKSLIWPCFEENGEKANIILDNIVNMISALGGRIVAEGVETKEQADKLTAMGIDYLQGYYFSRPLNKEDFVKFVAERNAKS